MRKVGVMLAAAGLVIAGAPASAADRMGNAAIFAGDYDGAVRHLEALRRLDPDHPELMLNLATAYGMTGRTAAARALYAQVLDMPAAPMGLRSGAEVSSHLIATRGLARLSRTIASR